MFTRPTWRSRTLYQVLATVLVLPFLLPLLWIVAISFEGAGAVVNYTAVVTQTPFLSFVVNSLIISIGTVGLVFASTMLAGYALGKLHFHGRELIFTAILAGLMLPAVALVVPLFTIVKTLGLFNNYLAVILPLTAGLLPMTILLTRNFVKGIPDELLDAARIDGATSFGALTRIVIPLSRPIIAVVIVWAFLNSWNEFFLPLVFLQSTSMQVITQIPTYFTSTYGSDVPKIFAALVLMCLPIVIGYLSFQKFFERGLTAGAIK
ncbi:MAG: carbohydrate ABC transporter permease [Propionibacteriaceae bacterium]|jgi:ABC-type glycerol-3-phosphate transport system permease component|nr:carbohydrate ABC transporter permease [Propionibacteriaceae bacterium]